MPIIEVSDLPATVQSVELVEAMVAGANARAARVAPCLVATGEDAPTEDQLAEAKLVLIGAVRRWAETGTGAYTTQSAGPFSVATDTRQRTGFYFWASEEAALRALCAETGAREAFSLDTAPTGLAGHPPYCSLYFGSDTCSCGYSLTGVAPIYEPW